jgi:hypothetical protein
MNDQPRNECPNCKCPDQLAGLSCGFCRTTIPMPTGALSKGAVNGAERLIGWKGMRVRNGLLVPPMYDQDGPWVPGEWNVATCNGRDNDGMPECHHADNDNLDYVPPVKACMCGYYSGRTREHQITLGYARYTVDDPTVLVECQVAGKVIPASNGWRAQKMRPLRIHVPHELWKVGAQLKASYAPAGVETIMGTTMILPKDAAPEWCPKCSARWIDRGVVCGFCSYRLNGA